MIMRLKRFISGIIAVFMLIMNVVVTEGTNAASYFSGGAGTAENPYRIMTKEQLCNISLYPDAHYILMRDLEFTDADFADDGVCAGGWNSPDNFTGVFDGLGNTIANLKGTDGGFVNENNGIIDSVIFENHRLSGTDTFGAVADINNSTITRCNVNLAITEDISPVAKYSGGVAGENNGEISYSQISGKMFVTGPQYRYCYVYTGGFAGESSGRITNCYNNAYINVYSPYTTEYVYIGGMCGIGNAYNCRNDGSMYINASMDYDIYASPFGNHPSYSSYFCYGSLKCTSTDNYKLNRYNTHNNMDCYTYVDSPLNGLEESFSKLDFDANWMITSSGPMPQGIMDADGNCYSKYSYTAPTCVEEGYTVYKNQYDEQKSEELPAIGHEPNDEGVGCLRDGCSENIITDISLNITEVSIYEGDTLVLDTTCLPENATDKTLIWISSDENVATVDENGLVTGVSAGEATVTVSTMGGKMATCNIIVEKKKMTYPESSHPYASNADDWQEYTSLDEDVKSLTIKFSSESYLEHNCDYVYIYDAEDVLVRKYTGSQLSGTEVSVNGNSFKIRLTSDFSVTEYGYKIDSVTAGYDEVSYYVPIEEIYIDSMECYWTNIGGEIYLSYTVYPEETNSYVIWKSSDESIAAINEYGVITVNGYGNVIITAESSDGMYQTERYITILAPTCLNADSITLNVGDSFKFELVSEFLNGTYCSWYSYDDSVVRFNDEGVAEALSKGDTYAYNTNNYNEVRINVTEGYSGYIVNGTYTIMAGQEYPLPVTGDTKEYIGGYSYDDEIAEYDSSSKKIVAKSAGECEIYTDYGSLYVRVIEPYVKCEYTVENGIITGYAGEAEKLVIPEEIDGKTIVGIGEYAFDSDCLKSVIIPGTVKNIGNYAFNRCSFLEQVVLEEGVETIGDYAFSYLYNLTYIELPASLKNIGRCAFSAITPEGINYNGSTTDWINLNIYNWNNDCLEVLSETHGKIYNKAQLYEIAEAVNSKKTTHAYKNFTLMNNISLENEEWTPIGIYDYDYGFAGNFDGNGYTVSDFKITTPRKYNGFFGCVKNGEVKNLKIKNAVIDVTNTEEVGWSWSGLMTGWHYYGNVDNCSAEGVVRVFGNTNENNAGGLIGRISSVTVSNCSADVIMELCNDNGSETHIGGLVGYMYGTVSDCTARSDIKYQVNECAFVGGITGFQAQDSVSVTGSTSRGSINGIISGKSEWVYLGGIIGSNNKLAENNTSYVDIVYSSKNDICAGTAIGGHTAYGTPTENNNIAYGSLYRAPYADFDFTESTSGYVYDYTITAPKLNGDAIFVSLYSKNKLLENIEVTASTVSGTLMLTEKPDMYKIFVWDDTGKLTPVHSALCGEIE